MLQRLSIRGKILAVVAVPILVLLLAVGVVTLNATQTLSSTRNVEQLLDVLGASRSFEADLQAERNLSVSYVDAYSGGLKKRTDAEGVTDDAIAGLAAEVADNPTPDGEDAAARITKAIDGSQSNPSLTDLRAIDAEDNGIGEWLSFPSADDVQAAADSYAAIGAEIEDIIASTPSSAGLRSTLARVSFAVNFEGVTTQAYLTDPAAIQTDLIALRPATNASEAAYSSATGAVGDRSENQAVQVTITDADKQFAQFANVRDQVVNRSISVSVLGSYYGDTIEPIVKLSSDVASVASDRTLAGQLRAYNSMDSLVERVRSEEVYTDHLLRQGFFLPGDTNFQRSLVALSDIALTSAQDMVDPLGAVAEVPPFGASTNANEGDTSSFQSIRTNIASGLDASLVTERGNDWPLQVSQELDAQIPIRDALWDDAQATSAATLQSTVLQTIVTIVGAVLVVIATIAIALLIARRIIGPLRRLTTTATAVRQELPRMVERVAIPGETVDVSEVQIPVESADEIGRLAEAFNGVNATTLAIASEQAALRGSISEMFVNVARRDQVLLNRQLSSIDDMERTEDDPETLTRLFALDHLATRMRRNSESLLVLAGIDTGRRLRRAMPLADVIRTASSEIELYERVQLELDADPAMVGHSALTAAHLFAELLENATVFSDPGTSVVVRTFERGGEFVVEVVDSGIGMTVDELRDANNRVASTAASEILGAQRLGLFVVGRIARRVGARVLITSQEGAGTTATVTMPASLFDARAQEPVSHMSGSTSNASVQSPSALVTHSVADEIIDTNTEPDATKRPGAPAYQPAAVESGASLAGRSPDSPAPQPPAPLPPRGPAEPSVDDLIAADAAGAPSATPVDTAALAGGVTASGLPARRRRANAGPGVTSDEERAKIIGLPARATADQLSALDAEAPSGFKPSISPEEIAPQTAEERASMFRGFRARKDIAHEATADIDPEAESIGQAARRGAVNDKPVADAEPAAPVDEAPPVPMLENAEPQETADALPSFSMPKFDLGDNAGGREDAGDAIPEVEQPMVVPLLEEDDEPAPAHTWGAAPVAPEPAMPEAAEPAPEYDAAPQSDAAPQYDAAPQATQYDAVPQAPQYGVEQVSLETGPTFAEQVPSTPPAPVGEPLSVGTEPAPYSPAQGLDPGQLAALTATPSMDELMAGEDDDKPNFFSRLFGRGKKGTEAPAPTSASAAPVSPLPLNPLPAPVNQSLPQGSGAETRGFAPAGEGTAAESHPVSAYPPVPPPQAPAEPTPVATTPQPVDQTRNAPQESAPQPTFAPQQFSPNEQQSGPDAGWQAPQTEPVTEPQTEPQTEPVTEPVTAPNIPEASRFFAPRGDSAPQQATFSPDQLASPMGWEAAGASALQAAEPDVQTSYSPKVDLDSDHGGGSDLSSVFREFSSLSAERPKVEKTRAGLQKRRAADAPPVEVTPIDLDVVVAPRERNADDVRSRFSSFYSGTARARSDAAEFERSQAATESKE